MNVRASDAVDGGGGFEGLDDEPPHPASTAEPARPAALIRSNFTARRRSPRPR
jgi:hypothetical protein